MITGFANKGSEDIHHGFETKDALKTLPIHLHEKARRQLDILRKAESVSDCKSPPGNRLEALKGDRKGFYSIRINDQFRIVFRFERQNASDVEICDYH